MARPRRRRNKGTWLSPVSPEENIVAWTPKTWLGFENIFPIDAGQEVHRKDKREWQIRCESAGSPTFPDRECCLAVDLTKNGSTWVRYRDRRLFDLPTWLIVRKQKFLCRTCRSTVTEQFHELDDERMMSKRFRHALTMSTIKRTFDDAGIFHGVERTLAHRVFHEYADDKLRYYEPKFPRVLGVDENRLLGAFRFVCADIESGKILDILPSREVGHLRRYFANMTFVDDVEVVCMDMWRGYETWANELFPKALVVIDKFHVVRYANNAFDDARIAYQRKLFPDERTDMRNSKRVFLKRWDDLSEKGQNYVARLIQEHPFLRDAYTWKERFFMIYDCHDRAQAEAEYDRWFAEMPRELRPFFLELTRAVTNWHKTIFNYFDHRYTNGKVESLNGRINKINDLAKGVDFRTLRKKAILRYGEVLPLDHFMAFSFSEGDDSERLLATNVSSGFNPKTLIKALKKGSI